MKDFSEAVGVKYDKTQAEKIIASADKDHNQYLNYEEFKKLFFQASQQANVGLRQVPLCILRIDTVSVSLQVELGEARSVSPKTANDPNASDEEDNTPKDSGLHRIQQLISSRNIEVEDKGTRIKIFLIQ